MIGADIEVSNSHEPSYYEIALTNRQVVVAFVILLVCLLCAFFSGVWIGRESTMRAQEQLRSGGPAQAQEKKEGQALEEFDFFDDSKRPAAKQPERSEPSRSRPEETAAAPEPERSRDTTLAEDLGGGPAGEGEDVEALREPAPTPAPTPARPVVLPTPEERRRATQAAQTLPLPGVKPEKKPAAAAPQPEERRAERTPASTSVKPKPLPEAEPAASSAAGSVVIQVFSSAEKDQAERIRDRLVRGGQKAYLSPVQVASRTMYRVRLGPFENRDKANKVADQVRKGFKLDTWVTE
jgi:cell division septation protein DedD